LTDAREGRGIIMISSDLPEIFASTDRLLVLHEGRLTATLTTAETTPEEVLSYAAGLGTSIEGRNARMSNQKLTQTEEPS
jgi:ABC-type sugar transport system ATPase subunit